MTENNKILLLARGGLGDTVRFLPIIRVLRINFPRAYLTVVVGNKQQEEIIEMAAADKIIIYDALKLSLSARIKFAFKLRRLHPRLFIATYENSGWRTLLLSLWLGAPLRVGYGPRPFFNRSLSFNQNRPRWEIELDILRVLGISPVLPPAAVSLKLPLPALSWARSFLKKRLNSTSPLLLGIHIGLDVISHGKCWPVSRYRELVGRILERYPRTRFLIFGGEDERALADQLKRDPFPSAARVLIGKTGLSRTAALLRQCRLLITNDGFLLHLAAAQAVPIVALFGPTSEEVVIPPHYRVEVVKINLPCRPCYRAGPRKARKYDCRDYRCIRDIKVEQVLAAVRRSVGEG